MMRIKEAIQRRKLIQQLNDEYAQNYGDDTEQDYQNPNGSISKKLPEVPSDSFASQHANGSAGLYPEEQRLKQFRAFVRDISNKLSYPQRRALRVTWNRLSEAPKTSGRGTLQIMEKVFDRMIAKESAVMTVYYRSAFIKCIEDRKLRCQGRSIVTLRDHAHLLIDFIDTVLAIMFDEPVTKAVFDPTTIGRVHAPLIPLGFDRNMWITLGECFAEVMFSQDVIRGYPHAAGAWSLLAVACTDRMYSACKLATQPSRTKTPSSLPSNSSIAQSTTSKTSKKSLTHSATSNQISTSRVSPVSASCRSLDALGKSESTPVPPNTARSAIAGPSSLSSSISSLPLACPFGTPRILPTDPGCRRRLKSATSAMDVSRPKE
uniref:GLOBIN domain-containing protein n=1 Tax=Panagrellus redivivus TaxID=6233 RepID=A0A7E4V8K2_PANRE